ncbi:phospholipase-like protein, partial [Tanacetum coccineum]
PYDCRVTIRSKLKMIPKIKERISSSKKRLDLFKNNVFGKWLDLDDTNYDNYFLNYVLHYQRLGLSKSIDSDILFDIAGRTLLLGRVEFCLVTEKKKDGELVQDKSEKGKAAQPSDKGDFDSVTIKDLGELVQKDAKWKKLSVDDSIRVCLLYMSELIFRGPEDKKVIPSFMLRMVDDLAAWNDFPWGEYYWEEFHNKDSNPTTKLQPTDAEIGQDGRGATVGAKVSGEAMNDVDMSAVVHVKETKSTREIVLKNKVESLEAVVEKLKLDHDKMAVFFENFKKFWPELVPPTPDAKEDPSDAAIDGEHMDAVGHPDENERPNAKEDPSDAAIDREHMDAIGSPNETEEPNAHDPISHVLNMLVDNGDVLMMDVHDTINLADPPSHESEIMSPCSSEKKGDQLDRAKANQRNKKKGTLLQDFLPVIGKDGKEIKLEPWIEDLTRDSKATKTRIHVSKEVLDFFNQVQKPGYRFPWGTGFTVDDKFWQCLVAKDANRKGWLNDSVIELWIQLMWHFRPKEADWSISSSYFSRLLKQNKLTDWIFNDHTYPMGWANVYIPLNIKNAHWFLAEFKIRTGVGMSKHGIFKKKDIDPKRYNITFEFSNHAPKQAGLYGDCRAWVCIMMYRLANGLSMDFPPGPIQTALAHREKMTSYFWKYKIMC